MQGIASEACFKYWFLESWVTEVKYMWHEVFSGLTMEAMVCTGV